MTQVSTNERILRSDVTQEECERIEKVLRRNNISYYEKWKNNNGIMQLFGGSKNAKCDIYIHKDSYDYAKKILGEHA